MCKPTAVSAPKRKTSLLLTTSSFSDNDGDGKPPSKSSTILTIAFIVAALFMVEHLLRFVLKDAHYLLENETNLKVFSRHLGVDFLACSIVAYLGVVNRHICEDLRVSFFAKKSDSINKIMHPSGFETRMYTYHPAAQHILLVFLAYQVKNLYDSYVWDDGPEFIFHHIFSGLVAWSAMYPGFGHFYVIFFMGISELSTAFLTLLANFDPKFGLDGASEAFPMGKVVMAVIFVITFIICRTIIWPYASYHFVKDALQAIASDSPKAEGRKGLIKCTMFSLSGLSVLQVLWLVQIFVMAKDEIQKLK